MTRYTATIHHHSISRAREVPVGGTLQTAKRNATREFGEGYLDHVIVITDTTVPDPSCAVVARRRIGDGRWTTSA